METALHRQLKLFYAADDSKIEVAVDGFRIDAIDVEGRLVEVQHAGLGSIRSKIKRLLESHPVRVIKPLIEQKTIIKLDASDCISSRRKSPKHADFLDLFSHLVHFTDVFPHKRLMLEVPIVHVEEIRRPQSNRRWRSKQYRVLEQRLVSVRDSIVIRTASDLLKLANATRLSQPFDTLQLAVAMDRSRSFAQQVAYVLHHCGALKIAAKRGNSNLYQRISGTLNSRSMRNASPSTAA